MDITTARLLYAAAVADGASPPVQGTMHLNQWVVKVLESWAGAAVPGRPFTARVQAAMDTVAGDPAPRDLSTSKRLIRALETKAGVHVNSVLGVSEIIDRLAEIIAEEPPAPPVAVPRSISLDGVDQWVEVPWASPGAGDVETRFAAFSLPNTGTAFVLGKQNGASAPGTISADSSTRLRGAGNNGITQYTTTYATALSVSTWYVAAVHQDPLNANASLRLPRLFLDGADVTASHSSSTPFPGDVAIGRLGTAYYGMSVRCWGRIPVAMTGAQNATLYALIAAGDDAGAVAYLLGLDASAEYHAVTTASDLTSGTVGGIADLCGNSSGSTPWNTDSGNLSTDVP